MNKVDRFVDQAFDERAQVEATERLHEILVLEQVAADNLADLLRELRLPLRDQPVQPQPKKSPAASLL